MEDEEEGELSEVIFMLSTPEINYELTDKQLEIFKQQCLTIMNKHNKAEMATPNQPSD